jgi:copper chaperone CopZ
VRSALTNVTGVISAEVSLPDKAVIKVQKDKVTANKLIAAVKKAGYGASIKDDKKEKDKKKDS